jgi:hypothetical protein
MKKTYFILSAVLLFSFTACDSQRQAQETETQESATTVNQSPTPSGEVMSKGELRVYAFDDTQKYPEAKLQLNSPAAGAKVQAGLVEFNYALSNYELTRMTPHGNAEHLANSQEGQHIHNIVDNKPYTAHYETNFTKDLEDGDHVILSFLSRSYHESLKHKDAYDLRVVTVGNPAQRMNFDTNGQHMFYSRPKGEYIGNDTKKIMLDFYLVNTDLAASGNKVRATINGTDFMLDRWLPYIIEGLPMGESTIKLELLDNAGNVVPGPFNTVERTITLKEN